MSFDERLALAVNRLPGHRGWPKRRAWELCRDEHDLAGAVDAYLRDPAVRVRGDAPDASGLLREAETESRRLRQFGISCRVLGEEGYPASLAAIDDPPFVLYVRGTLGEGAKPAVALVGTRRPSAAAGRQAFRLGLEFSFAGYPVVSGLAFGIDKAAHEGALAAKGATWAVLAGGLDRPSPMAHRKLAGRILDGGGALVGEMPPGRFPGKYAFPRRNRILSGLCRGCVVVQAPEKSGALITADFALEQGRDLYVADAGLEGLPSDGTRSLEAQGAPVIRGAADVMGDWGRFLDVRAVSPARPPESGGDLAWMMKSELQGRMHRFMGGWFEYRGA